MIDQDVSIDGDGKEKKNNVYNQDNVNEFFEDSVKDLQIGVQDHQTCY